MSNIIPSWRVDELIDRVETLCVLLQRASDRLYDIEEDYTVLEEEIREALEEARDEKGS